MATRSLPKVTQYVKNVGKSIAFASVDAVKANTSGISDFVDYNEDVFKEAYASVRNYRTTLRNTEKSIRQSNLYQAIDAGLKNMIEDAKTGNLYHDRTDETAEFALGLEDDDFNLEMGSDDESSSATQTLSDSFNQVIGAAATSQNTTVAQGTNLIVSSNKASTKLMLTQMDRMTAHLSSSIGAVYAAVDRTNQFLNGPVVTHIENSRKYYETTTDILREQQLMMKEMLEMQRNLYKVQSEQPKSNRLNESMRYDGSVDIRGYMKNIKGNISDFADSMGLSMFNMDMGGGNPFMLYAAAPFKMVLEPMMQRMMSNDFKKALRSFDKGVTTMFSQAVARMNTARDRDDGSLLSVIGKIFGITLDKKETINTANYRKEAVPFDGVTRQAIIEVIPGYLSRIEAALSGSGERHYDFKSGAWKSANQIQKDYEYAKKSNIANANYDIRSDLADLRTELKSRNEKYEAQISKSVDTMMAKIYADGGDFRPQMGKGRNNAGETPAWKYYGFASEKDFDMVVKRLSKNTIRNMASNNMEARQGFARRMREEEMNGGVYRHLFNGAYNNDGSGSGTHNPSDFVGGTGLLSMSKDKDGHNVFWYLREILSNISYRNGRRRGRGSTKPQGPRTPSGTPGGRARESESSSTESEGDSSTDDDIPWDDIENERRKQQAQASEEKKFGSWLQSKLEKTSVGRYFSSAIGAAGNILSKPMEYATKLLNKADENMFKMMFGVNEFKDEDGQPIESVFSYIMYKIKHSFNELTNWLKKNVFEKLKETMRPYWEKYGKPVADEVKGMASAGFNRVKQGLNNTFGKGFRTISEKLRRGDVVSADEVENAPASAGGRVVTKRGLTMISPGEIIIPASFDKREQQKMLALEKRDKRRILNAIGYNAAGTVDTDAFKKHLEDIYNENKGKGAKVGAGGILGAGAGLLTGVNPLLGALAGAGLSILNNSETFKKVIFGEEITNEDGSTGRKGGVIPKKVYDIFKKAAPDMGDFGIAGGLLGLFTPFGPLGGAAIGAGVGFLKNSESFKKFIFGDAETDKDGFISKETYDKFINQVKKAAPKMAIGAGLGALLGPFGILGNAAMGAGVGLLSSTETFHKFIFGDDEGNEGLVGAFKTGVIEPAKEKIAEFAVSFKEYAKKNILDPMKNFWDPFQQAIKNTIKSTADRITDHINDMFERTVGIPLHDFLQEKLFKPITKLLFGILKAPIAVGKAIVAAPFRALGGIGNSIRMGQIQRGTAYDMSASDRLAFRDKHKFRASMGVASGRDKMLEQDLLFAGLNEDQLETLFSTASAGVKSEASLQKELGVARNSAGKTISDFFNTKSGGKNLYDAIQGDGGYNTVKKIAKQAADGDFDGAVAAINNLKGLSDEQKKDLINKLSSKSKEAKAAAEALKKNRNTSGQLSQELSDLVGHKVNGRKDMRKIYRNAEAELKARRKQVPVSEEQAAIDNFNEANKARTEKLLTSIKGIHDLLESWIHPKKDDTNPPGDVKNAKEKDSKIDDTNAPTSEASKGTSQVLNNAKSKNKGNGINPLNGLPTNVDEDSKEYKEAKAEKEAEKQTDKENLAQNKESTSILSKFYEKMFGSKQDKEKKGLFGKGGFIGSLASGLGSFLKFMGVGGKIVLAATGVSLFGHATEWFKTSVWPTIKTALFGKTNEDGSTTNGLFGNIKNTLMGEDGFFGKFTRWLGDKFTAVREWYEGNGGLSGILVNKVLPKLITGWGYAVDNVVAPLTALLIKSLPGIAIGLAKGILQGLKMAIFNKTLSRDSTVKIDTSSTQKEIADLSSKNSSAFSSAMGELGASLKNVFGTAKSSTAYTADNAASIDISGIFSQENDANNQKTGIADTILGSTHRTNEIEYDENGNIITDYTQFNKTDSALSRIAGSTGRSFGRALAGDAATGLAGLLGKASTKGVGRATSVFGGITKATTAGLGAVSKGTGAAMGGATKLGGTINKLVNTYGPTAAGKESGNVLVKGLTKIFTNLANSKVGSIILSCIKKVTGTEVTQKVMEATLVKLGKKLAETGAKTAGKAVSSIATAVAGFSPLALAFMVTDFVSGYDQANTILGVAAGDTEYQVGFGQKCLCGLLNLINNRITLGLIPTSTIVDIIVEFLFPLFGLDATSLKEAQGRATAIMDEWNKANPDETYDNLQDFNNKDKWWFKAWNGIKEAGSNFIGTVKEGASNAWGSVKTGVTAAIAGVRDFGENAKEAILPYIDSIKGVPSLIKSVVKDSMNYAKTGEHSEEIKISDDDPLSGFKNVIKNVARVVMFPVAGVTKLFLMAKESIFDPIINAAKSFGSTIASGVSNVVSAAWNGDIIGAFSAQPVVNDSTGVIGNIAKVVFNVLKVPLAPVILLGGAIGAVKNGINSFVDAAKQVVPVVSTAISNRMNNAWHPAAEGEDAASEELMSTGNGTLDGIANVVYGVAKVVTTPAVLLGKGINLVKTGFDAFCTAAGTVKDVINTSISSMMELADQGDLSGVTDGVVESTGNEVLDTIANVAFGVSKVALAPVALIRASVGVVKEGINKIVEGYKTSQSTKEADDAKIEKALSGDVSVFSSDYWSNADHSGEGLFGVLANVQTYIEKIFNAPVIMIKGIGAKIADAFSGIKDWFGDTFGGIWSWITGFFGGGDKDEAVEELEKYEGSNAASGRGKRSRYGLGHSYQTDPSIADIRYGDSTIGKAGCAPVAAANVLNNIGYAGNNDTVKEAAKYAEERNMTVPGGGTNIKYFNSFLGSKGLATSNTSNKDSVMQALNQGNQVIMLGRDKSNGPGAPYGTTPHYITAVGVDSNGNIIAEDPYYPQETVTYNGNQALNSMVTSVIVDGGKSRRRAARGRTKVSRALKGMGKILFGLGGSLGPAAIINVAKSQVGVTEVPKNQVKYNYAYYGRNVNGDDYPWCCAFVWWVFNQAGAAELFYGGSKTAYCPTLKSYYESHGQAVSDPKPGDIVYFNWDHGTTAQHVGIVVEVSGNTVITVEGNTGGNNANGGAVMQRSRNKSEIIGFSRPNYPYTYDASKVVDMSKYGDTTDYRSIAMNGGSMTGDSSSYSSSSSSSSGNLLSQFSNLGNSMVKAMYGEDAFNAFFGTASSDFGADTPGTDPNHTSSADLSGNTDAQKIWNYLKGKGFTDIGASGIMGCWQHESGNKPNRLEGDYLGSFPGFNNVLKSSSTLNDYTTNTLFPAYARSGISINKNGYKGTDGNYYPGIGLAQWTGPRGYQLFNYAKTNGRDWKDLGTQLDFFSSELSSNFKNKVNATTTPQDAAHAVLDGYEMYEGFGANHPSFLTPRQNSASSIYTQFAGAGRATAGSGKATNAMRNAYSKKYTTQGGGAARALSSREIYAGGAGNANVVTTASTGVDYHTFLQTIVSVLMNISDNTALLTKILDVLSQNFNIKIDKSDIDAASSKTKEQTEAALNDLVQRSSGNNVNVSKLLNNKDTQYILTAMQAIASE